MLLLFPFRVRHLWVNVFSTWLTFHWTDLWFGWMEKSSRVTLELNHFQGIIHLWSWWLHCHRNDNAKSADKQVMNSILWLIHGDIHLYFHQNCSSVSLIMTKVKITTSKINRLSNNPFYGCNFCNITALLCKTLFERLEFDDD